MTDETLTAEMTCQQLVELVTDYLEGALGPQERARLEAHLAGCEGCGAYLDQMRVTIDVLGRLRGEHTPRMSRLAPLPPEFAATRLSLHRLAVYVVAPARRAATGGEISLRVTPGGFGTPPGEDWGQVRVEGTSLVARRGASTGAAAISSLADAARLAGVEIDVAAEAAFDVPPPGALTAPLPVDTAAAGVLAAWYELGAAVLAELARRLPPADEPSPIRLWPEHFDIAIEAGDAARGRRAVWGFSPGDAAHAAPYAYVSLAPEAVAGDPFFDAAAFAGALLGYEALAGESDPAAAALAFFQAVRSRLDAR